MAQVLNSELGLELEASKLQVHATSSIEKLSILLLLLSISWMAEKLDCKLVLEVKTRWLRKGGPILFNGKKIAELSCTLELILCET